MEKKLTVGLFSHNFFSDNLGVQALSYANLNLVNHEITKKGKKAQYVVFGSFDNKNPTKINDLDISFIPVTYKSLFKQLLRLDFSIFRSVRALDVAFDIGEGDSFSDIYGLGRLMNVLVLKFLCKLTGVNLIHAPQTLGPFKSFLAKKIALFSLPKSTIITARDYESKIMFEKVMCSSVSLVTTDVAMSLDIEANISTSNIQKNSVGIGVSGLLFNGGYKSKNDFSLHVDYKKLVINLIRKILEQGYDVYLISHVISERFVVEDDFRVCLKLHKEFNHPNLHVAPKFENPYEAKKYISKMSFFVGSRMHSVIAAFSSEVPCLSLAYSRKFGGLFSNLEYPHNIDLRDTDEKLVIDHCLRLISEKDTVKKHVQDSMLKANKKIQSYSELIYKNL